MAARAFEGSCHCGALEFTFETAVPPKHWEVRACQCTFCRAHGAVCTSDPEARVQFRYVHPEHLRRYRFGLRTADFLVCKECGCYLGAVMMTGSGAVAVINLNVLKQPPRTLPDPTAVNYRSESLEERRARRRAKWTPVSGPV